MEARIGFGFNRNKSSEILGHSPLDIMYFNCNASGHWKHGIASSFRINPTSKVQFLKTTPKGRDQKFRFAMNRTSHLPGSNPVQIGTTAVRERNQYRINGHNGLPQAADGAAFTIVMAVIT